MNLSDFAEAIQGIVRTTAERRSASVFRDFLASKWGGGFLTEKLCSWEFSEFTQMLTKTSTEFSAYSHSVCVRKLCRKLEKQGAIFKTSPLHWKTPRKPDVEHFSPLTDKEYHQLTEYISKVICQMRDRLQLVEGAKHHTSMCYKNGNAFSGGTESFAKYQITLKDALSALLKYFPDFPVDCDKKDIQQTGRYGLNSRKVDYDGLTNEVSLLRKRFSMQRIRGFLPTLSDAPLLTFSSLFDILYPTEEEAAAIRMAICLETGWSPDLVGRINPNDWIFTEIDPHSDAMCIKTTKAKGTQRGNEYSEAKSMIAISSKSAPESAYNLIRLWLERTAPIRATRRYTEKVEELGIEPFFVVATRYENASHEAADSIRFIAPGIINNSSALHRIMLSQITLSFDERQLRPTHLYYRSKNQGIPFALLVTLFGHSNSTITDEFYRGGGSFVQDRKDRLGKELIEIQNSISDGTFSGSLVPIREKKSLKEKVLAIYSDASAENPIAFCSDPFSPTWTGHQQRIKPETRCRKFSKCLLCARSRIFTDNLPFVVDRYLYLQQQKRALREHQFKVYLDEYNATKQIVDSWPYRDEVDEAKERTFIEGYILPPVLLGD